MTIEIIIRSGTYNINSQDWTLCHLIKNQGLVSNSKVISLSIKENHKISIKTPKRHLRIKQGFRMDIMPPLLKIRDWSQVLKFYNFVRKKTIRSRQKRQKGTIRSSRDFVWALCYLIENQGLGFLTE